MARRNGWRKARRNSSLSIWLMRHAQTSLAALGRLSRRPISTLMTAAVIGIALALPTGLHLLVGAVSDLGSAWRGTASISLFLSDEVTDEQAVTVQDQVEQRPDVASTRLIDRDQALAEFRQLSGFGDAIDLLHDNPLPAVVLVQPQADINSADAIARMADQLEIYREIDLAQVDLQWIDRLAAISGTIERAVLILAGLLSAAVLLIVGNTVRLEIENCRGEIEIVKLVGGTNAFIRRPFLYEGILYGLLGSLIGLLLVVGALQLLDGPVQRLAGLYASDFSLAILDPGRLLALLAGGPGLGLAGSWLAVGRHLAAIEPD